MSVHYLVPVQYTCDTYGCTATAMGHERFRLTAKNKLELDILAPASAVPEGWVSIYAGVHCPACAAEDRRRHFVAAVSPPNPGVLKTVTQAAEAVKLTRQASCRGCVPACDACPVARGLNCKQR